MTGCCRVALDQESDEMTRRMLAETVANPVLDDAARFTLHGREKRGVGLASRVEGEVSSECQK